MLQLLIGNNDIHAAVIGAIDRRTRANLKYRTHVEYAYAFIVEHRSPSGVMGECSHTDGASSAREGSRARERNGIDLAMGPEDREFPRLDLIFVEHCYAPRREVAIWKKQHHTAGIVRHNGAEIHAGCIGQAKRVQDSGVSHASRGIGIGRRRKFANKKLNADGGKSYR